MNWSRLTKLTELDDSALAKDTTVFFVTVSVVPVPEWEIARTMTLSLGTTVHLDASDKPLDERYECRISDIKFTKGTKMSDINTAIEGTRNTRLKTKNILKLHTTLSKPEEEEDRWERTPPRYEWQT